MKLIGDTLDLAAEAENYAKEELAKGRDPEEIRQEILNEGIAEEIANDAIAKAKSVIPAKNFEKTQSAIPNNKNPSSLLAIISVILIAALIGGYFLYPKEGRAVQELPKRTDPALLTLLNASPTDVISLTSSQTRYERVLEPQAKAIIAKRLRGYELDRPINGFQRKTDEYSIISRGQVSQKTLVSINFKPNETTDAVLFEALPSTTKILRADGRHIEGIITFDTTLEANKTRHVSYLIEGRLKAMPITFSAKKKPVIKTVCGDQICDEGFLACCTDCGCPSGFTCTENSCKQITLDRCFADSECDDADPSTRDSCTGIPKDCTNTPITECTGDGYCAAGCTDDPDCTEAQQAFAATGETMPVITGATVEPAEVRIGENLTVSAKVEDPDLNMVWFQIEELVESHEEAYQMLDDGKEGDATAGDGIYSSEITIADFYLTGTYHVTVYAEDNEGNVANSPLEVRVI